MKLFCRELARNAAQVYGGTHVYKRLTLTTRAIVMAGALTFGAGSHAFADQTHVTLALAAGASSQLISIPIANNPVIVSCVQTTGGNVGTGQATLVRSTTNSELVWNGYDISGIVTNGQGSFATHIVFCDFLKKVDIQAASATQIKVVNATGAPQTVAVMLTY